MIDQISQTLGICKKEECDCSSEHFYELLNDNLFFIYDDDSDEKFTPCRIVSEEDEYQICVVNENEFEVTFIKIDQCLIINNDHRKCDCALISNNQFFFIEIKNVKLKQRKLARKEAIQQLKSTIEIFKQNLDLSQFELYAIIGFKTNKPYIVQSSKNTQRVMFKSDYDVVLQEGSQIVLIE